MNSFTVMVGRDELDVNLLRRILLQRMFGRLIVRFTVVHIPDGENRFRVCIETEDEKDQEEGRFDKASKEDSIEMLKLYCRRVKVS